MTILSKVQFRGTCLRKCAKRCSVVGHGRERGDDRKQRTDGESCVMSSLPYTCSGFIMQRSRRFDALNGSASTREGEKVRVGVCS